MGYHPQLSVGTSPSSLNQYFSNRLQSFGISSMPNPQFTLSVQRTLHERPRNPVLLVNTALHVQPEHVRDQNPTRVRGCDDAQRRLPPFQRQILNDARAGVDVDCAAEEARVERRGEEPRSVPKFEDGYGESGSGSCNASSMRWVKESGAAATVTNGSAEAASFDVSTGWGSSSFSTGTNRRSVSPSTSQRPAHVIRPRHAHRRAH